MIGLSVSLCVKDVIEVRRKCEKRQRRYACSSYVSSRKAGESFSTAIVLSTSHS